MELFSLYWKLAAFFSENNFDEGKESSKRVSTPMIKIALRKYPCGVGADKLLEFLEDPMIDAYVRPDEKDRKVTVEHIKLVWNRLESKAEVALEALGKNVASKSEVQEMQARSDKILSVQELKRTTTHSSSTKRSYVGVLLEFGYDGGPVLCEVCYFLNELPDVVLGRMWHVACSVGRTSYYAFWQGAWKSCLAGKLLPSLARIQGSRARAAANRKDKPSFSDSWGRNYYGVRYPRSRIDFSFNGSLTTQPRWSDLMESRLVPAQWHQLQN